MNRICRILLVLVLPALSHAQTTPLSNSKWILLSVTDFTNNEVLKAEVTSRLHFTDSVLYVSGCNAISARYRIAAKRYLRTTGISSTDAGCHNGPFGKIEEYITTCFFDLAVKRNGDTLELYSDKKGVAFRYLRDK
jgi:hypothetical protein